MDQNEEAARQPPRSSPTAQQQSLRKPPPSPASRQHARDAENRSLDFVQRMVISALIIVVFGLFAGSSLPTWPSTPTSRTAAAPSAFG